MLIPYENSSVMRSRLSDDPYRLYEPSAVGRRCFAEQSFSFMAPRLFNKLPIELKRSESTETFKSKLKTYIFQAAFDTSTHSITPDYSL